MHGHLRLLVLAVCANVLAFAFVCVLGILLKTSAVPSSVAVVVPAAPVAQALIRTEIISPEIVPEAQVLDNQVLVRGVIVCTAAQTLPVARHGHPGEHLRHHGRVTRDMYPGEVQKWRVPVTAHGGASFARGAGAVQVWSTTLEDGDEHMGAALTPGVARVWLPLIETAARTAPAHE